LIPVPPGMEIYNAWCVHLAPKYTLEQHFDFVGPGRVTEIIKKANFEDFTNAADHGFYYAINVPVSIM
jgi:hypothetical protein